MPLLKLETSATIPEDRREALLTELSHIVTETLGKPEKYVMVTAAPAHICMSGAPGDAAFVEVRSIGGLDGDVNRELSRRICAALGEHLGIPENRVYLNFTDVAPADWGWNASTFG